MQPVRVILKAVEVVKGDTRDGWSRREVHHRGESSIAAPWPVRPSARCRWGRAHSAWRIEQAVLRVEQPINRIGGAVGLRTILGRSEVDPTATPLQHHRGHRPAEVQRRPLGHAPQALRKLPCGRCLIDLPGPVEDLVPHLACTVLLHLQDRVEKAQHQRDLGEEPPAPPDVSLPSRRCRPSAPGSLARGSRFLGTRALAPLHGHRIGGLDHAHAQATAAANPSSGRRPAASRPGSASHRPPERAATSVAL